MGSIPLQRVVVSAVLGTWVIGTIQATGRSAETAVDLVSDLLATWLATRALELDGPPVR